MLLSALLLSTALLVIVAIYAGGFGYLRDRQGFSDRRVTFTWVDRELGAAFDELFPKQEIRFLDNAEGNVLTLRVTGMKECDLVFWLSDLCDIRIRRIDGVIVVSGHSWISRCYIATHGWLLRRVGFSPWGPADPWSQSP